MNDSANDHRNHDDRPVTGDRLDALLRAWHDENRTAADAMRGETLRSLAAGRAAAKRGPIAGRIGFLRAVAAAALLALATVLGVLFLSSAEKEAFADGGLVQVAEGGALDALDADGNALGPCPLQRTEVKVEISGLFARTIVEQTYANPYPRTIEAVYTFPLSERAAVDRMTMVVRGESGEKIVEGEVRERSVARAIYEEARESGYVASLLEQERPNIFTQSVANIEPGATVKVRIATIEIARRRDGVAEYVFPMVVGPRYIPGASKPMPTLPEGWEIRPGVVLRAPAGVEIAAETPFPAGRMLALLEAALPIRASKNESIDELLTQGEGIRFSAKYGNGSAERGTYWPARGIGEINGRFFHAATSDAQGTGFAGDTDRVPDASRITPMPVKPNERAGHDIGVRVTIDSGGPAITDVSSELHAVRVESTGATTRTVALEDRRTIPNRDFILRWKVADAAIEPSFFAHVSSSADPIAKGGYFALMLEPPARVAPAEVRPRELVFVLDTSGSMNGFPIEKSKELARKAIAAMRPNDTFNFITFAGATSVLWPEPRPATEENRRAADAFIDGLFGSGGTEMMAAINTALVQEGRSGVAPSALLDLPADGRAVRVAVPDGALATLNGTTRIDAGAGRFIRVDLSTAIPSNPRKLALIVDGSWTTRDGERVLAMRSARFEDADARTRMVFFLTDGYIGNDQAVIAAVRENARASRVFTFGIGNSVNRFLLEEMARAGRGACEVVTLATEADAVVARLVRRIESPVLTDIALDVPASLGIRGLLPGGEHLPDLYDQEPIVLLGRFDRAATGVITIRGRTGAGAWEKQVTVALPETEARHDVVPTLWARGQVDALLAPKLESVEQGALDLPTKREVIRLGETYRIATPFTSFVAVERSRVVVGGKPMLVSVPVELPEGTNWAGFFGEGVPAAVALRSGLGDIPMLDKLGAALGDATRDAGVEVVPSGEPTTLGLNFAIAPSMAPAREEKAKSDSAIQIDDKRRDSFFGAPGRPPLPPVTSAPMGTGGIAPSAGPGGPSGGLTGGLIGGGGGFGGGGANAPAAVAANSGDPRTTGAESLERRRLQRPAGGAAGKRQGEPGRGGLADARDGLAEATQAADLPMEPTDDSGSPARPAIDRDRFVRVFELRLLPVAIASVVAPEEAGGLVESLGVPTKDGAITVVVLVAELDDATRKALADAGFRIDGIVEGKRAAGQIVVGGMQPASLAKLADIKAVRRVEIARPNEAEAR